MKEWFSNWFDSPYYHLLYFHRDDHDARSFIDKLLEYIRPGEEARILDLACGRGRHAIYLNQKGYNVTGLDLSPESIGLAQKHENESLHFATHDMRDPLPGEYDLILNLFTSFGYFSTDEEHITALRNISDALRDGGGFLLDYMNAEKVKKHLVAHNEVEIEGIHFDLKRRISNGFIEKDISFTADGKTYIFTEHVRAFSRETLIGMIETAGMRVREEWGSYVLDEFDSVNSDRLILFCTKA